MFCKSRKSRRAYEKKKLENQVKEEEKEEPKKIDTVINIVEYLEGCKENTKVVE